MERVINNNRKKILKNVVVIAIFLHLNIFVVPYLFAQSSSLTPTPQLTPEQIAKHPTDKWFTAVRPDYSELDERIKTLAKNEETPQDVARIICEGLTTDIEKARAIFDWLAYNVSYDTSYKVHSAAEAFKKRKGVCQGYAELFQELAEAAGINSIMVTGIGYGGPGVGRGGHAWNLVKLEDRDLLLDSCWGAGYVTGSHFVFKFAPQWFDTHPAPFAFRHFPDDPEDSCIYPFMTKNEFNRLPWLHPESYYPYGASDPVEAYRSRFCKDDENLPVTFNSGRDYYYWFEYISTGPELTDGFLISDFEVTASFLRNHVEKEQFKELPVFEHYQHSKFSAITDMPLIEIAKYCNYMSEWYNLDPCYTISEDGQSIECDYSQFGIRLPTKKEWLAACGTMLLNPALSEKDFSDSVWYNKNTGGRINIVRQTKENENYLSDILGNVSELCWDEENGQYVFMGGNVYSSREEILSLKPVPFDNYEKNKGANGFRLVITAPQKAVNQYLLAQYYKQNNLVRTNRDSYLEWVRLASDNGNVNAIAMLGSEYYTAQTQEGYQKCYELCMKAAEYEQHYALQLLARLYLNGDYVQKDEQKAYEYFERSANAGNLYSMYLMALAYKNGDYRPQNKEKYFYWMERAINGGYENEDMAIELARCYKNGLYCEKNEKKAFEIFSKLAKKDDASIVALVECADCYIDGTGCRKSYYDARKYFQKAFDKGSIYAKARLADCAFYGYGIKRDVEGAVKTYEEIIESGYSTELYKAKYDYYKANLDVINFYDDKCKNYFHNIPEQGDFVEYMKALASISELAFVIQGTEMTNSALLRGLKLEKITSQIIEPMKKVSEGKALSGKTIVIINPYKGKQYSGIQQEIFTYDCFNGKKYCVNGEYYRYDKSFFEYYNNIIILQKQEENLNSIDTAFKKLMPCLAGCDEVDLMLFSTDYFKEDSDYVFEYKKIAEKMADKGTRPRIIVFGNKTDSMQQNINRIFSGDEQKYAEKINVFGTPCNMKDQLACGFRNDKLFIVLLTERISSHSLLLYLDETGWAPEPNRKDVSFVQSQSDLNKMAGMGVNKGGTISKPGKMVMHYKNVK